MRWCSSTRTRRCGRLERLQPDIHCKGADWEGSAIPERETVEAYGGRIAFTPLVKGLSTTDLSRKIEGRAHAPG